MAWLLFPVSRFVLSSLTTFKFESFVGCCDLRYRFYEQMSEDNEPYLRVSCDTIRKKINIFLATKEMTQTAFLLAIGKVNNNSYQNFMRLKGSNGGCNNGTFYGAAKFFYDRDQAEKQAAKEQKAKDPRARLAPMQTLLPRTQ
jgi:hypothetical protein